MADYERRVRLTLTAAEAKAVEDAITISLHGSGRRFFEGRHASALERADRKLAVAFIVAADRNAEKRRAKADTE